MRKIGIAIIYFCFGGLITLAVCKLSIKPKTIIVLDELHQCENLGGRYSLDFNRYSGKYYSDCMVESKTIYDNKQL